ncbi:MAG: SCP2 sterol-binding domain-containing protein, partial [Oscillospiraceae bacterium]|nr:SCP2 sterol-binding domain-containing protein [Oscillospiraceae bacterium]
APAKGGRRKAAPTLDAVTAAVWKKIGKASVRALEAPTAIQVIVYDLGTFYVAIKDEGGKRLEVMQATYDDRAGTLEASYEEIMKIAAGKYNFLEGITKGKIVYKGDVKKALAIAGLFK